MKYILMERGKQPSFLLEDSGYGEQYHDKWFALEYHQAHKPVLEQTEAVGHAVRAMYLYSGMADLAKASGDEALFNALKVLWTDVTTKKMYITGRLVLMSMAKGFRLRMICQMTVPMQKPVLLSDCLCGHAECLNWNGTAIMRM